MITVRVPASSGNLGPGFDALGLALGLYDEVHAWPADDVRVEVTGEGAAAVPRDHTHLVARAVRVTLDALGVDPPGFGLRCHNVIPHSRGLGSSASAAVAGVAVGYALAGVELDGTERAGRALQLAAGFEGHADNAAPSLLGGAVVAWTQDGVFGAARLQPHPAVAAVLLVPAVESSTAHTRGLLPRSVPLADAAFNVSRAALMVHAITAAPELLMAATADLLHQPYRRGAYPATADLVDALRAAGVPAVVSGAGPTVLALTSTSTSAATGATADAAAGAPAGLTSEDPLPDTVDLTGFTVLRLPVDQHGVRVEA